MLEGGSIASNGPGTLIAVESSILTDSRNPGVTRGELEEAFEEFLGINRTIWLERGLVEDETDGHADNVVLFVSPTRVLCQTVDDPKDPNAERLAANRAVLEDAGFEVIDFPVAPGAENRKSRPYLNCFVGNACLVVPLADVPADEQALDVLRAAFPGREVLGVPGETLARAGGGVHCITQQIPLAR